MAFSSLPNELISHIVEFAALNTVIWVKEDFLEENHAIYSDGIRALHALSAVSHLLHKLVEPILYLSFMEVESSQVPLFLRTIIERPDLAMRIKTVDIHARNYHKSKGLIDMSYFSTKDMQLFLSAISHLCSTVPPSGVQAANMDLSKLNESPPEDLPMEDWESDSSEEYFLPDEDPEDENPEVWYRSVRAGKWDAFVAILLPLLPSLEQLHLDCYPIDDNDESEYLQRMILRAVRIQRDSDATSPASLRSLHSVAISSAYVEDEGDVETSIQDMVAFFELPSVTRIIGTGVVDEDWIRKSPPSYATKELYFNHSALDSNSLVSLLKCTPNIEKFNYQHMINAAENLEIPFIPHKLNEGLAHLKNKLVELSVFSKKAVSPKLESAQWEWESPLGSLSNFKRLTYISTSAWIMVGQDPMLRISRYNIWAVVEPEVLERPFSRLVDVVPESLEILELSDCEPYVLDHIRELLEQKEIKTPRLGKVILNCHDIIRYHDYHWGRNRSRRLDLTDADKADGARLVGEAAAKGVELLIRFSQSGSAEDDTPIIRASRLPFFL